MTLKTGILVAVSALGLLGAAPAAHADSFHRAPVVVRAPRERDRHVRWAPRVVVAPPPVVVRYPVAQPVYTTYEDSFVAHVDGELSQLESSVRARVSAGQLDGSALTAMESGRDDIREDLADVSAKGYIAQADRIHIENDVQALRQKLGC